MMMDQIVKEANEIAARNDLSQRDIAIVIEINQRYLEYLDSVMDDNALTPLDSPELLK